MRIAYWSLSKPNLTTLVRIDPSNVTQSGKLIWLWPCRFPPRLSYDPTRYPRYIPEAYCLCKGCLLGRGGEESQQHRSTPVYAPSVILKRTGSCVAGRHSYTEVYVSVAVGCTCVPLLERERGQQSGNRSLERAGPRARPRAGRLPGAKMWKSRWTFTSLRGRRLNACISSTCL